MSRAKQVSKRKRSRRAGPILGAAGLSLSLAGGASAATGGVADLQTRNAAASHEVTLEITLGEEEITGVSLASFRVFDKENGATFRPGVRLAMGAGGGGCGGCGACGGCWTGTDYTRSVFGSDGNPQYHSTRPAHKYTRAPKTTNGWKNQ